MLQTSRRASDLRVHTGARAGGGRGLSPSNAASEHAEMIKNAKKKKIYMKNTTFDSFKNECNFMMIDRQENKKPCSFPHSFEISTSNSTQFFCVAVVNMLACLYLHLIIFHLLNPNLSTL